MSKRTVNNIENTVKEKKLRDHREAGRHRIDVFLRIELHLLFLELLRIICILLFELFKLGAECRHSCAGFLLLYRQWKQHQSCYDSKQEDRNSVVFEYLINSPHYKSERIADELRNKSHTFLYLPFKVISRISFSAFLYIQRDE